MDYPAHAVLRRMQELLRLRRLQHNPDTRSAQLLRLRRLQRLRLQVIHTAKAYTPDGGKAQRLCRFFARRESATADGGIVGSAALTKLCRGAIIEI